MEVREDTGLAGEWAAAKSVEVIERIADAAGKTNQALTSIAVQLFDDQLLKTVNLGHRETYLARRRLPDDVYNAVISLADQVEAEARQVAIALFGSDDPGGYRVLIDCLSIELMAACALCREVERGNKQTLTFLLASVALAGGAFAAFAFIENRKRKRQKETGEK